MATIQVTGDRLTVELSFVEKILAVHGSLHIPLAHVLGARVADENAWSITFFLRRWLGLLRLLDGALVRRTLPAR